MSNWCTIESDPGVFTELIAKFGVKDVQVEEVWDLDDAEKRLSPIYGYIFLFKYIKDERKDLNICYQTPPGLFYAKQVISNACATQAIVSVLMNHEDVELGDELKRLKIFTTGFQASDIGAAIGNDPTIRKVHNSFARQDPFQIVSEKDEKDEAFHLLHMYHIKAHYMN
eukprot:UN33289